MSDLTPVDGGNQSELSSRASVPVALQEDSLIPTPLEPPIASTPMGLKEIIPQAQTQLVQNTKVISLVPYDVSKELSSLSLNSRHEVSSHNDAPVDVDMASSLSSMTPDISVPAEDTSLVPVDVSMVSIANDEEMVDASMVSRRVTASLPAALSSPSDSEPNSSSSNQSDQEIGDDYVAQTTKKRWIIVHNAGKRY